MQPRRLRGKNRPVRAFPTGPLGNGYPHRVVSSRYHLGGGTTMTQKTNDNTSKATSGTQGNQGNVGAKSTGQDWDKSGKTGSQGSQMGGKTSPAGGPETFESDQVNQGKIKGQERTSQGGSQAGRGDPYPPVNPDRPVMGAGQEGGKPGGGSGQYAQGGNFGAKGGIEESNLGGSGKAGLEEE